jgi:hypothetical protein
MARKISRRTLLRNTAALTTGVVAASTATIAAAEEAPPAQTETAPDHDPATGEIFDRDRHHRWDTV